MIFGHENQQKKQERYNLVNLEKKKKFLAAVSLKHKLVLALEILILIRISHKHKFKIKQNYREVLYLVLKKKMIKRKKNPKNLAL